MTSYVICVREFGSWRPVAVAKTLKDAQEWVKKTSPFKEADYNFYFVEMV